MSPLLQPLDDYPPDEPRAPNNNDSHATLRIHLLSHGTEELQQNLSRGLRG